MKSVNVHEAKSTLSSLLAEVERCGTRIVICRNGKPVADLIPHRRIDRRKPDAKLGKIKIKYDPVEELAEEDWPPNLR
jgi:prevent-host-death family protein